MADVVTAPPSHVDRGDPGRPKKYVRIMTDKRREQNRRAQKAYRDKLKRKLEDLEGQVASSAADEGGGIDVGVAVNHSLPGYAEPDSNTNPSASNIIDLNSILESGGDLAIPQSVKPTFYYPPSPPPPPPPRNNPLTIRSPNPPVQWTMPHRDPSTAYTPPPSSSQVYMSGSLTAISPAYAYSKQIALLNDPDPNYISTDSEPIETIHRSTPTPTHVPSPSPYTPLSPLTLTPSPSLAASLAIAVSLGISHNAYLEDHPSNFPICFKAWYTDFPQTWFDVSCDEVAKLMMKFVMSDAGGVQKRLTLEEKRVRCPKWAAASWATVHGHLPQAPAQLQAHMSSLPHPLRPRPIQLIHSHPSYLDCIVFPRFRERAVQASVEGTLDHVEFFLDLMHGGLVCWGAGSVEMQGINGRTRGRGRRGMRESVPWSTRSWEARRWFLKKWSWLVGTEEEEEDMGDSDGIWRSSRWWWSVRGEEGGDSSDGDSDDESDEALDLRRLYEGWDGTGQGASRFDLTDERYEFGK